jgi:hypothetical protein
LDAAYLAWFKQHIRETEDPNPIINSFGLSFGQYLVDNLSLNWVVVSDEQGTEIAVHGQPGNILVFPPNLVAKRYVQGKTDFFSSSLQRNAERNKYPPEHKIEKIMVEILDEIIHNVQDEG